MKKEKTILILFLILLIILILYIKLAYKEKYYIDNNNRINFENRPKIEFTRELIEDAENYTKEKIAFDSKGTKIYGYLYLPKIKEKIPGIIFLPAAQATKEGASVESKVFLNNGFAVITIDQRGIGETKFNLPNVDQDYNNFQQNKETLQALMVYDALRSFDLLKEIPQINNKKILISGSSMGGRTAIIAAAIEKNIHGVLIISSAGYTFKKQDREKYNSFLDSINPNNYISLISPRKIIMIHSEKDSVIPIWDARLTYDNAKEPKKLTAIKECNHGFCDEMIPYINQSLKELIYD